MVDVDSEYSGIVIDKLTGSRRGILVEMKDAHEGKVGRFACYLSCPSVGRSVYLSVCFFVSYCSQLVS